MERNWDEPPGWHHSRVRDTSTYQNGELAAKQLRAQGLLVRLQLHDALLQPRLLWAESRHGHPNPPPTITSPWGTWTPRGNSQQGKLHSVAPFSSRGLQLAAAPRLPVWGKAALCKTGMGKVYMNIYTLYTGGCSAGQPGGHPAGTHAGMEEIGVGEISMATRLG